MLLESYKVVAFDVDDTLIKDDIDPDDVLSAKLRDKSFLFSPHRRHVNLLRTYHRKGFTIIVWSQGGYDYANSILNALGVSSLVSLVMTKPSRYIDDLPASAWMQRMWIDDVTGEVEGELDELLSEDL